MHTHSQTLTHTPKPRTVLRKKVKEWPGDEMIPKILSNERQNLLKHKRENKIKTEHQLGNKAKKTKQTKETWWRKERKGREEKLENI